jgi:hypothetical protein
MLRSTRIPPQIDLGCRPDGRFIAWLRKSVDLRTRPQLPSETPFQPGCDGYKTGDLFWIG